MSNLIASLLKRGPKGRIFFGYLKYFLTKRDLVIYWVYSSKSKPI